MVVVHCSIREFHEENTTPVIGLPEGGMLRMEGETGRIQLKVKDSKIFQRGKTPVVWKAGTDHTAYAIESLAPNK